MSTPITTCVEQSFTGTPIVFDVYCANISASIGWNGQGGSMQFKLVEDLNPCPGDDIKEIDDIQLRNSLGKGFRFQYGSLNLGGIYQRFSEQESSSGKTYDIVVESPSKLMDGVPLILEEFTGATDIYLSTGAFGNTFSTNLGGQHTGYQGAGGSARGIGNYYNIFGQWENPALIGYFNYYGGSGFNSAGLRVDTILNTLQFLAGPSNTSPFGGRLRFGQHNNFTQYYLDVSEVIGYVGHGAGYRVKGPVKSVNALLSELGDAFQFNYFYDIQYGTIPSGNTGGILNGTPTIKVRVANKNAPPNTGAIDAFITQKASEGRLASYNKGKEYSDNVSQKLVIGGARTRYQAIPIANCFMVTGKNRNTTGVLSLADWQIPGTVGAVCGGGPGMTSTNPRQTVPLVIQNDPTATNTSGFSGVYYATLLELRMALGGQQTWETFKCFETRANVEPNGFNDPFTCPWTGTMAPTIEVLNKLKGGPNRLFGNHDLLETDGNKMRKYFVKEKKELASLIFKTVSTAASTFAMQEFIVPLVSEFASYIQMAYVPPGDFEEIKAWETSDAAFLQRRIVNDIAFCDGSGRQKSMITFPTVQNTDYSALGGDYAPVTGIDLMAGGPQVATTKGSPDKEQIWIGTTFAVPFKAGCTARYYDDITTPDFGLTVLANYFFNVSITPEEIVKAGMKGVQMQIPPDVLIPRYACVPQESTRYTFGPWGTISSEFSFAGKAEVEKNESLRPEAFGGWAGLYTVGGIMATAGVTKPIDNESGSVDIAGLPEANLGDRLQGGPYITDISVTIDATGGVKTSYKMNTYTLNFGKLAKYNIDRISRINKNLWQAAKKMRDRIEKRPLPKFKFEKADFEEVKQKMIANWNGLNWAIPGNQNQKPPRQVNNNGGAGANGGFGGAGIP
ncbi:MAG: hypothetical protein CL833_13630 [Crocinitomicaceae bacterium]|nr:hypothetical protein [Crocinitomicaceae bacterium]